MMPRGQPDPAGLGGHPGQEHQRRGQPALFGVEVVLGDPADVEAERSASMNCRGGVAVHLRGGVSGVSASSRVNRPQPLRHAVPPRYASCTPVSASSCAADPDSTIGRCQHVAAVRDRQRQLGLLSTISTAMPSSVLSRRSRPALCRRTAGTAPSSARHADQPGPAHQRPGEREHLLLAARQRARGLAAALRQARKCSYIRSMSAAISVRLRRVYAPASRFR